MFRRKSSSKKISEGGSRGSSTSSSLDTALEGELEGEAGGGRQGSPSPSDSPSEVLLSLLTPPVAPELSYQSQLQDNPFSAVHDILPSLCKLCEWSLLYCVGWFGGSYAWVLLLTLLHLTKNTKRNQAKLETELSPRVWKEREESILHNLGPSCLPSWVTFPDTDRAEWINVILRKVWPNIGKVAAQVVKLLVEPKINEILKRLSMRGLNLETLSSFRIKDFILGDVPARVGGIRVYDRNTGREEIVMDIEVIYAGDARVKFSIQNMDCEINQVSLKATARVVLKPLLDVVPIVGGLELYFISIPTLDYNLGGMAAAGELPGVSNLIRSVLDSIIKRGFVWPNRFSCYFPLESVTRLQAHAFPMSAPQGVLWVGVREGRDLVKKDKHLIGGKSDPYVVLSIGESKLSFVEQYVDSSLNPVWNYEAHFPIEEPSGLTLGLEVFDFDNGSEDDFLGRASLDVTQIVDSGPHKDWVELSDAKHGAVHLEGVWRPIIGELAQAHKGPCVVSVWIDSCRNLQSGRSSPPFSKAEIKVGSLEGFKSSPKKGHPTDRLSNFQTKPRGPGESPVFQEGHTFIATNLQCDHIAIQVSDHRTNCLLGRVSIKLPYLAELPQMQFNKMEWPLEGSLHPEATITISAKIYAF